MSRGQAKDRMIEYLPPYYQASRVMGAILLAQGQEIDKLYEALDQTLDQFYVLTATWGLSWWEKILGLPVDETMPVDERRRRILVKRRGVSQPLLVILRAIEPGLEARFGGDVIPFVLPTKHNTDEYDFGPLVPTLEIRKPAHKAYSFQLLPPDRLSGYAVYGNHDHGRGKVSLQPEAGAVYAGRWPRWDVRGTVARDTVIAAAEPRVGFADYYFAGVSVGTVAADVTAVAGFARSAAGTFRSCGTFRAGEVAA